MDGSALAEPRKGLLGKLAAPKGGVGAWLGTSPLVGTYRTTVSVRAAHRERVTAARRTRPTTTRRSDLEAGL